MTTLNELLKKDLEKYGNIDFEPTPRDLSVIKNNINSTIKTLLKIKTYKQELNVVSDGISKGLSVSQISKETGFSYSKIIGICKKNGLKNPITKTVEQERKIKLEQLKKYEVLYNQGKTVKEISKEMNLSVTTIQRLSYTYQKYLLLKKTS